MQYFLLPFLQRLLQGAQYVMKKAMERQLILSQKKSKFLFDNDSS